MNQNDKKNDHRKSYKQKIINPIISCLLLVCICGIAWIPYTHKNKVYNESNKVYNEIDEFSVFADNKIKLFN